MVGRQPDCGGGGGGVEWWVVSLTVESVVF